jgi:hypothetical protein
LSGRLRALTWRLCHVSRLGIELRPNELHKESHPAAQVCYQLLAGRRSNVAFLSGPMSRDCARSRSLRWVTFKSSQLNRSSLPHMREAQAHLRIRASMVSCPMALATEVRKCPSTI